jgi:hypothetical protein
LPYAPGKSSLDFAVALQQLEPGRLDKKKAPSKEKTGRALTD